MKRPLLFGAFALATLVACALVDPFPDLAATPPNEVDTYTPPSPLEAGRDASGVCEPGETRGCGFESCQGVERCSDAGAWLPCDARDASTELCGTALDESCDGVGVCTGDPRWLVQNGDLLDQHAMSITTDGEGNAYVVGTFLGDLSLGGFKVLQGGEAGQWDAFIAKVSRAGTVLWLEHLVDTRLISVSAGANDIVAAGNVNASSTGGPCGALEGKGYSNVLVTRWSFTGKCLRARTYGTGTVEAAGIDRTTDDAIVTGNLSADLTFGGPPGSGADVLHPTTEPGVFSVYLARIGSDLVGKQAQAMDAVRIGVRSLAVAPDGHVAVAGVGGDGPLGLAGAGVWLATFDRGGAKTAAIRLTNEIAGYNPDALGFTRDTRLVMVGSFSRPLDLQPWGGPTLTPVLANALDVFLLRTSMELRTMEGVAYGDIANERPRGIAIDADDHVVVTGSLQLGQGGPATLGGATFQATAKSDVFVAKYGKSLEHVWSHALGGAGNDLGVAVAVGPLGDVFTAGDVEGVLLPDGGAPADAGTGAGIDLFVVRQRP